MWERIGVEHFPSLSQKGLGDTPTVSGKTVSPEHSVLNRRRRTECSDLFQNCSFVSETGRSLRGVFPNIYFEDLVELLEVKLTEACARAPHDWVFGVLTSQSCPHWAPSNFLITVQVVSHGHWFAQKFLLTWSCNSPQPLVCFSDFGVTVYPVHSFSETSKKSNWFSICSDLLGQSGNL